MKKPASKRHGRAAGDPATLDAPAFRTVAEAARFLGVSPSTVWRWIEADKLRAYRIGPRGIRIREEDAKAAIQPATGGERVTQRTEHLVFAHPPPEELARHRAPVEKILREHEQRNIAPLTSADLVHLAREQVGIYDGPGA